MGVGRRRLTEQRQRAAVEVHRTRAGEDVRSVRREVEGHATGVEFKATREGVQALQRERARADLGEGAGSADDTCKGCIGVIRSDGDVAADGRDPRSIGREVTAESDIGRTSDRARHGTRISDGECRIASTREITRSRARIGDRQRRVSSAREVTRSRAGIDRGERRIGRARKVSGSCTGIGGGERGVGRAGQGVSTRQVGNRGGAEGHNITDDRGNLSPSRKGGTGHGHTDLKAYGGNDGDVSRTHEGASRVDGKSRGSGERGYLGARGDARAGDRHTDDETRSGGGEDQGGTTVTHNGGNRRGSGECSHLSTRGDTRTDDWHTDLEASGRGRED